MLGQFAWVAVDPVPLDKPDEPELPEELEPVVVVFVVLKPLPAAFAIAVPAPASAPVRARVSKTFRNRVCMSFTSFRIRGLVQSRGAVYDEPESNRRNG